MKTAIIPFLLAWLVSSAGQSLAAQQSSTTTLAAGVLLAELTRSHPELDEIIFCARAKYDDPHWYANIGYYCDDEKKKAYHGNGLPDASKLLKLRLKTGEVTVVLDGQGGTIRDPQVHYDARKVLFSYRPAGTEFFHLYEINLDGSNLKQLTSGEFDDYEPAYLPDGGIAFVSTRCKRWVNCWMTQVGIIYRCNADGSGIEAISANTEHDNTPWVLPDGRILYTRWEYVDRSQVEFHHLWAMNPDGTGQTVYFGNMHPHILMIDAKPIPNTDLVIASFSPGHGVNEHAGVATIVAENKGPDDRTAALPLHRGKLTRDPYALSTNCFLMARGKEILLMDGNGQGQTLLTYAGDGEVHEPRPILQRARERIIPRRTAPEKTTGLFVLSDVYHGRNMNGVNRGDIKKLLILESLAKPVNFSGGPDLISWLGTFTLERVVGVVPVEADGSAAFEAPANRQLFFVALDENDLSVKRMQSFTSVMPGEVKSCAGCHEDRTRAPAAPPSGALQALSRPPSRIEPIAGIPDVLDFQRDVQPILNEYCVRCHNYEKREGQTILAGDLGPQWSHSFFTLFARLQVADGRNGLGNQAPRSIGSSASPLLKKLNGGHYDVKVSARDWRVVWAWIESGAPFAGSYGGLRNEKTQRLSGMASGAAFGAAHEVLQRRCGDCHGVGQGKRDHPMALPFDHETRRKNRHLLGRPTADHERIVFENDPIARYCASILVNFSRPKFSPILLGPLSKSAGGFGSCPDVFKDTTDPDYLKLLAAIERGKSILDTEPRFGSPDFKPNPQYIREMKKYGVLPPAFDPASELMDVFQTDQLYWKSLWHQPANSGQIAGLGH